MPTVTQAKSNTMKQVIQHYKTGAVTVRDVPTPQCRSKTILVQNYHSLLSIGTERSIIALGKKSLLGKARARPDLVKRAIDKAKKEGLRKTFQEAMGRLDTPTPLGYSSAGVVIAAGDTVQTFSPGDRIACIGQGYASHAEMITVPLNLACKIPDNVSTESAAFGMLGTIAMHGVRCAQLTLGSNVVVVGLGLLGLLTVQLLKAYGCRVFAMDIVEDKLALATQYGAEFVTTDMALLSEKTLQLTQGHGADATVLTLATASEEPVNAAINYTRTRGKIVVVGTANIHPNRNELWHKEIELVVSKASGPGALDPSYEIDGIDIPIAYARWTQQRNLAEFLRLLSTNKINVNSLITHRYAITDAEEAYAAITDNDKGVIGAIFNYPQHQHATEHTITFAHSQSAVTTTTKPIVSVIGAGTFGRAIMLPLLAKRRDIHLKTLATSQGASAEHNGRKFGFQDCSTDAQTLFHDPNTQAIVALTPHSTHFETVCAAIRTNKPLFIEKPLCVNQQQLDDIIALINKTPTIPPIVVGHNRRFSPHTHRIKQWLRQRTTPLVMAIRVNAGYVAADHWVHSEQQGRSRIIGEMGHFVDLMQCVIASVPTSVHAKRLAANSRMVVNNDNVIVTISFADGSLATLTYTSLGYKGYSREFVELFFDGNTIVCHDFRKSYLYHAQKNDKFITREQAMGYSEELDCFFGALTYPEQPLPSLQETLTGMQILLAIETSLQQDKTIHLSQKVLEAV